MRKIHVKMAPNTKDLSPKRKVVEAELVSFERLEVTLSDDIINRKSIMEKFREMIF